VHVVRSEVPLDEVWRRTLVARSAVGRRGRVDANAAAELNADPVPAELVEGNGMGRLGTVAPWPLVGTDSWLDAASPALEQLDIVRPAPCPGLTAGSALNLSSVVATSRRGSSWTSFASS
jgi:hypothetical protein